MSNLNNIEQKLYKANFKSEFARQQCYLAIHAALSKTKDVPRIYAPHSDINENRIELIFKTLLFSDINIITEYTNKYISALGLSAKQISNLSIDDKEEVLSLIDYLLLNGWGKGNIIYDYLRLSPKPSCTLLNYLKNYNLDKNDKYVHLIDKLDQRLQFSIKTIGELNKFFPKGERNYNPTILSKSYEVILEKNWRQNWSSNLNYITSEEEELFSKLIFMEEIWHVLQK